jgi:hypothetical protein
MKEDQIRLLRQYLEPNTMSSWTVTPSSPLNGSCFCGAIKYELSAPPVLRAYCHCTKCQRMTGMFLFHIPYCTCASSQRFCVQVARSFIPCTSPPLPSRGSMMPPVDTFVKPVKPWSTRTRCRACGVTVASHNSRTGEVSVWGAHFARDESGRVLRWDEVRPTAHIFYGTRLLDVGDDLGKWEGYEGTSNKIA